MNLFIFNFKKILPILLTAVLLSVMYRVFLYLKRDSSKTSGTAIAQSQFQENVIKIESYQFRAMECEHVIVGSSLMARLEPSNFQGPMCNLALGGESATTGLTVIDKSGKKPKVVMIELNFLKAVNFTMVDSAFGFPQRELKKASVIFLESSQPVVQIVSFLKSKSVETVEAENPQAMEIWLNVQKNAFADFSSGESSQYENYLLQIKKIVDGFKEAGIKVIFVILPIDSSLMTLPKFLESQKLAEKVFPKTQYQWADILQKNYGTTDGLHLKKIEAQDISKQLDHYFQ